MQDCRSNNSVISARNLFVTAMASKTQNCNLSMALAVSTEEVQTVRPSCVHTHPNLELQLLTNVDKTSERISANLVANKDRTSAWVTFPLSSGFTLTSVITSFRCLRIVIISSKATFYFCSCHSQYMLIC